MSVEPAGPAETLPGLEIPDGTPASGYLEEQVRHTIRQLQADGHVTGLHAGKVALALELAGVIAHKRRSGRASTIGNDARVLMEILDSFIEDGDADGDAGLKAAMQAWAEQLGMGG